jgi:2-methylcitrate dehydratase PrpD
VHGKLDLAELTGDALTDPVVLRLADCIELVEAAELDARFPAERLARVEIETMSGMLLDSGVVTAAWDDTSPPTDAELHDKFRRIAGTVLPGDRTRALEELIWNCAELPNATALLELLAPPA